MYKKNGNMDKRWKYGEKKKEIWTKDGNKQNYGNTEQKWGYIQEVKKNN